MRKLRYYLTGGVFVLLLFGFLTASRIVTPPVVSQSERRVLATFPPLTVKSVVSAEFMNSFEDYAADSFVLRDTLRTVRAATVFQALRMSDKAGLYLGESGAGKFEKVNEREYRLVASKLRRVAEDHLGGLNIYYAVVPDKSVYAGHYTPGFDPALAAEILAEELPDFTAIDLTSALRGGDFYKTDLHWDQSKIGGVVSTLGSALGAEFKLDDFTVNTAGEFSGVYPGQLALPMSPDVMTYLTRENTQVRAEYLNTNTLTMEQGSVYDLDMFRGRDPYNLFLRGPQAIVVLENASATSSRTLYIFRDSFGSSLAPLLAEGGAYSEIVLIDLRYIDNRYIDRFVTFAPGSDALFLYSAQVLNNSSILKVE